MNEDRKGKLILLDHIDSRISFLNDQQEIIIKMISTSRNFESYKTRSMIYLCTGFLSILILSINLIEIAPYNIITQISIALVLFTWIIISIWLMVGNRYNES